MTRICVTFDDLAKAGFRNPARDGGNTPKTRENSVKSGKVGRSDVELNLKNCYRETSDTKHLSSMFFLLMLK